MLDKCLREIGRVDLLTIEQKALTDTEASPEANLIADSLRRKVNRVLATLASRESHVIRHYYGLSGAENIMLAELGTRFNMSTELVRQIREKATED